MSWVGEQPAAPESIPNCRDPACRNPPSPEAPRQGNLESKGFRANQHPRENTFGAVQSSSCPAVPLFSGVPARAQVQGCQWWLGLQVQAPVWSTLPCSESYCSACGLPSPRSQSPPVTAWHRNWCLHIFSLFLSFFPFPQTIQATCLLILCFLLVSTLSPAMVMKLLLLLILFVVL